MTLFICQNHVNKLSQHYTRSFKTNQSALFDVRVPSRQLRCCTLLTVVTMTPSTVWISLHNRSNIFLSLHRNHSELNSFIICHPIYRAYRPIPDSDAFCRRLLSDWLVENFVCLFVCLSVCPDTFVTAITS